MRLLFRMEPAIRCRNATQKLEVTADPVLKVIKPFLESFYPFECILSWRFWCFVSPWGMIDHEMTATGHVNYFGWNSIFNKIKKVLRSRPCFDAHFWHEIRLEWLVGNLIVFIRAVLISCLDELSSSFVVSSNMENDLFFLFFRIWSLLHV